MPGNGPASRSRETRPCGGSRSTLPGPSGSTRSSEHSSPARWPTWWCGPAIRSRSIRRPCRSTTTAGSRTTARIPRTSRAPISSWARCPRPGATDDRAAARPDHCHHGWNGLSRLRSEARQRQRTDPRRPHRRRGNERAHSAGCDPHRRRREMDHPGPHRRGRPARPGGDQRGAGDARRERAGRHHRRVLQRGGRDQPGLDGHPRHANRRDLDGATIEQMLVKSPVGVVADLSESAKDAAGGSRAAVAERLRGVFRDALEYERRKTDFSRAQMQALSASARDLDALLPVLHGRVALIAYANRRSDIETALRLAKDFKLKLILAGAAEGWEVAAAIAAAGVPVLVEPLSNIPGYDALGIRYGNAGIMAKAGVKVALLEPDTHKSRNLRQQAGNAVSYGMTWNQALRAVTLSPAEIFGVADRYGSLEPGKVANVVVWSGDPFEFTTGVEHVLIRGKEIPLKSRQTELLERYKKLPPTY